MTRVEGRSGLAEIGRRRQANPQMNDRRHEDRLADRACWPWRSPVPAAGAPNPRPMPPSRRPVLGRSSRSRSSGRSGRPWSGRRRNRRRSTPIIRPRSSPRPPAIWRSSGPTSATRSRPGRCSGSSASPSWTGRSKRQEADIHRLEADERRAAAEVELAGADVEAAAASLEQAKADLDRSRAHLEADRSELERVRGLVDEGAVTRPAPRRDAEAVSRRPSATRPRPRPP